MRVTFFVGALSILTFLMSYGQTKVNGNYIQTYAINAQVVSYTPTSPPIGTLRSSTRILELYKNDYVLLTSGGSGYSSILVKENGIFKAYKYSFPGSSDPFFGGGQLYVDNFQIKQLNETGLPELILKAHSIRGNMHWTVSQEYYIVIDFDLNKVLWDLCSGYDYNAESKEKKCYQSITFSNGQIEVGNQNGNICNPTPQDAITDYKAIAPGVYIYKNGSYNLPSASPNSSTNNTFATGIDFNDELTLQDALDKAKKEGKLVFLYCYTSWGGPCKRLASTVFTDSAVGAYFNNKYINVKFDMEKGEGTSIATRYQVTAFPTLLWLDGNGAIKNRVVGGLDVEGLINSGKSANQTNNQVPQSFIKNQTDFKATASAQEGTIKDRDGNVYHTVKIGSQQWMKENLRTSHYDNGSPISEMEDKTAWVNAGQSQIGVWCYYDNNAGNNPIYGKLYNWYAVVDQRHLCPTGWHVPSDGEFKILTDYLGGKQVAGDKMKATTLWKDHNTPGTGADNSSGFSAMPAAYRRDDGLFYFLGEDSWFWSSTAEEGRSDLAWGLFLFFNSSIVYRQDLQKRQGNSVRCVGD